MPNWWLDDPGLRLLVERRAGAAFPAWEKRLVEAGRRCAEDLPELSALADRHRPVLHRYDRFGTREDRIEYHPAYDGIRRLARDVGIVASAYGQDRAPRVVTMSLGLLFGESEAGYFCPVCLTDGTAFVLEGHAPELAARFVPRLASSSLDDALEGAMWLTEKDGGSDVGGGTRTVARKAADGTWTLTGEKWFCSNADAALALTLARPEGAPGGTKGLALFLLPRRLPDGRANRYRIERLKEKLGVVSMVTGEIALDGASAWLVKPQGEGFRAMAQMLNLSRIYNSVASVAVARRAVRIFAEEGARRVAFGKPLREHALWRRRAVDLAVRVEAATGVVLEACALWDRNEGAALRALTPVAKAVTAKLAVEAASEACESLGGNGYVEDFPAARLLRDAQVLPIWEGTTNVLSLDLLRALEEGALDALLAHLDRELPADAPPEVRGRLALARAAVEGARAAPADAREAGAWELAQAVWHAAEGVVLAADAAWGDARGSSRKARVLARLLAAPSVDDLAAYAQLVEGSA